MRFLRNMPITTAILWCYAIWYATMVFYHFDTAPTLWLTSMGISGIVGIALTLSTGPLSLQRWRLQRWQMIRLFIIPFCVSSFSALVKGQGFILIFSPVWQENSIAALLCLCLLSIRLIAIRLTSNN